jgi:hypothetical protein
MFLDVPEFASDANIANPMRHLLQFISIPLRRKQKMHIDILNSVYDNHKSKSTFQTNLKGRASSSILTMTMTAAPGTMSTTNTSSESGIATDTNTEKAALLKKAQAMIELERSLTATIEKVEPWLPNCNAASNTSSRPRVRPLPTSMEQVDVILAVARNWAARTSAPAGWNPAAPVMGFTTPNPMPHQLRGGALAGMQLERARQGERDKKRQRLEQQQKLKESERAAVAANKKSEDDSNTNPNKDSSPMDLDLATDEKDALDPKHREISKHEHELQRSKSELSRQAQAAQRNARTAPQQQDVSMNLSDSSSDEDD